jgi:2'-5' RNA ligase
MSRLFVALPLPDDVGNALCALAPPHGNGVRVVTQDLLHVTVHFLGEADLDGVVASLGKVRAAPFALRLTGGGRFDTRDEAIALWVGVERCPGLLALHQVVGAGLTNERWHPEERAYTPHITLARCKQRVAADVIDGFLARAAAFDVTIDVREMVLFASEPGPSGPLYSVRHRFPLEGA